VQSDLAGLYQATPVVVSNDHPYSDKVRALSVATVGAALRGRPPLKNTLYS